MSKGFGNTNNIDRKKEAFKRAIESHDIDKLNALIDHYRSKGIGRDNLMNTLSSVLDAVSASDSNWFHKSILSPEKYQQMQDMAQNIMVESLVEDGCEIGKDFSRAEIDSGHCFLLSDKAQKTILNHIHEEHHNKVLEYFGNIPQQNPVTMLEEQLGVPFFENLMKILIERLPLFTEPEASAFLDAIVSCIFSRHPEFRKTNLSEWILGNLANKFGVSYIQRLAEIAKSDNRTIAPYWFDDVLKAANAEHLSFPHPEIPGDRAIGFEGLMLLDKIAQLGDYRFRDAALKISQQNR